MSVVFFVVLAAVVVPARLNLSESALTEELKQNARGTINTHRLVRRLVLIAELSLSVILCLNSAGLVAHFVRLNTAELGFKKQDIVTADLRIPLTSYPTEELGMAFFERFLETVRSLPGVQSAGLVSILPMGGDFQAAFEIEGRDPGLRLQDKALASLRWVSPGFHETLGFRLMAGRLFGGEDRATTMKVAIIDEMTSRVFWSPRSPIGERIRYTPFDGKPGAWITIVGIVNSSRQLGFDRGVHPTIYIPLVQNPDNKMKLVVRTADASINVAASISRALSGLDKDVPLANVRSLEDVVMDSIWRQKLASAVLTTFAFVALALTAIGLYGVISFEVSMNVRDIAVRMALGASRLNVLGSVGGSIVKDCWSGMLIGTFGGWGIVRAWSSFSELMEPMTAPVVCLVLLLFGCIILLAAYVPLRNAIRIEPSSLLR